MIVLYTDGFIEAIDKHNLQQFDANTWLNSFIASDKQSAVGVKNQLLYAFNKKIKSQDRGDDLALLVIKFL